MAERTTKRFKLTIAYDGTMYHGWQVQAKHRTVQQAVEHAIQEIVKHPVRVQGSGRTDQGVHARGQVAHVDVVSHMGSKSLLNALNARLPTDIRILKAVRKKGFFHARKSAISKEYRYFVWNGELALPDKRLYMAHIHQPLDLAVLRDAAKRFVGRYDFASFVANPSREVFSTVRTVTDFTVTRKGREFCFRVRGEGFLYKQVRSMVGFLLRVGVGGEPPEAITELLDTHLPRTERVPSATPNGLFLWRVWYKGKKQD
ncbi:MAG: tRNA pseudouridine(38-40) synthase TruA [Kiritimatiellaeota bacterium]|nr:tRNA pseudouridine(38-40) synthase TruA [Kiritimatiellota bacterium]